MASEIKYSLLLNVTNGSFSYDRKLQSLVADQAGTHFHGTVQDIGFAAHEALVIPAELATLGFAILRNLDATNYLEVGMVVSATFYPMLRLGPGRAQLLQFSPAVAPYAKANTAACKLEFGIAEV